MLDNIRVGQDWHPIAFVALGSLDAVHTEASWQAGDTSPHRFERFSLMMRDVVLEDLDHCDPGLALICDLGFAAQAHNLDILLHSRDHASDGVREDCKAIISDCFAAGRVFYSPFVSASTIKTCS